MQTRRGSWRFCMDDELMSSLPRGDGSSARPRILLAGGGHTHLAALVPLVTQLPGRADIAVMAPDPELLYSGMMPGWLANQYTFRDCAIPLRAWALSVGARWLDDAIAEVDFSTNEVVGVSGSRYGYDVVSLNGGSRNALGNVTGDMRDRVLAVKPFSDFVRRWQALRDATRSDPERIVVIGSGHAGVEIACAMRARWSGATKVALVTRSARILSGASESVSRAVTKNLSRRGIDVFHRHQYLGARNREIEFQRGTEILQLPCDLAVIATGAQPPQWLTDNATRYAVATATDGRILVNSSLRSVSKCNVFASGDCASFTDIVVPKSGLYALRQASTFAAQIAATATQTHCEARFAPQERRLAILNYCDGEAHATWGRFQASGGWVWRWKDHIDRTFMRRFQNTSLHQQRRDAPQPQ